MRTIKTPKYGHFPRSDPQAKNAYHPTFKFILKYKNNSRVNDIYKEIRKLIARKAAQSTDILVTILKEIADILSAYICNIFKATIRRGKFPSILKNVDTTESPQSGHLLR